MDTRQENRLTPYITDIAEVRKNWGFFLVLGLLLIALGATALYFNVFTTLFSVFLLGVLLIISGIAQIIQSFLARKWSGLFLSLIAGVLYIVVGFLCVTRPLLSAASLTILISAFLLVSGLARMFTSALIRFEQWGWVFFNGIVTFLLGVMIYLDWPLSGLWIIGMFVGIDMILSGWSWTILAWSIKSRFKNT